MENSMQEQTQNDKMVPIDTSGDPVEVELKEDEKKEEKVEQQTAEPEVQVEEVQQEEPKQESKEEELEEYSASVKRRIDKLTKLEAAMNAQDVEKQVAAQQEIARLTIEDERLKVSKAKAVQRKNQIAEAPKQEVEEIINNQPQDQQPKTPDPKAVAWAEKNEWFGTDNAMTYTAYDIHNQLITEGIDARDDEYYTEIDRRIRKEFPHKFNDGGDVQGSNKPVQTVASANRTTRTGRNTVRLTPSQVAIAKKLGVPLEEYAKYVKE